MRAEPNYVFVARVTRIPHGLFLPELGASSPWRGVIGRLLLIDCSARARLSNTTIVYTLFPHVARTLRNVQTSFAGPSGQHAARRCGGSLERFPAELLDAPRATRSSRAPRARGAPAPSRPASTRSARRNGGATTSSTTSRCQAAPHGALPRPPGPRRRRRGSASRGRAVAERGTSSWMKYFYGGLDPAEYRAALVPGGGRGALQPRRRVPPRGGAPGGRRVSATQQLDGCRARLDEHQARAGASRARRAPTRSRRPSSSRSCWPSRRRSGTSTEASREPRSTTSPEPALPRRRRREPAHPPHRGAPRPRRLRQRHRRGRGADQEHHGQGGPRRPARQPRGPHRRPHLGATTARSAAFIAPVAGGGARRPARDGRRQGRDGPDGGGRGRGPAQAHRARAPSTRAHPRRDVVELHRRLPAKVLPAARAPSACR